MNMCLSTSIHIYDAYMRLCFHRQKQICVILYTYTFIFLHIFGHAHTHIHLYVCMCVCLYFVDKCIWNCCLCS